MKVRITTETHEHEDTLVKPGTVLDVSPKMATELVKVGAAELVDPAPPAATKSTAAPSGGAN